MRRISVVLGLVILLGAAVAVAQVPKAEVYLGYAFTRWNPGTTLNNQTANGGLGALQLNFNKHFGFVAEMGGSTMSSINTCAGCTPSNLNIPMDQTQYTFLFGPRISFNKEGRVIPFFHYLVGGMHNSRSFNVLTSNLPPGWTTPTGVTAEANGAYTKFRSTQTAFAQAIGGGMDLKLGRHMSFRPVQLDWLPTNFSPFNIPGIPNGWNDKKWQNNLRYSTGFSFLMGGAPPVPVAASCSTGSPSEVLPDEAPVTVSATGSNFNPKHQLTYAWTTTGGTVEGGNAASAKINPAGLAAGTYTAKATITDPKAKKNNVASCSTNFTVKQPRPPVLTCSASPNSVQAGANTPVTLTVQGSSPDGRAITSRNFSATSGTITEGQTSAGSAPGEFTTTATLDTSNAKPGQLDVNVTATDVRGLSGSCTASIGVNAPPPPPPVVHETSIGECAFPNVKKPWRVDNECKAVLDEVAMRLQREPDAKLIIVGYADPEEEAKSKNLAAERAVNSKAYLTSGEGQQQIDPSRISAQTGTGGGKKATFFFLPSGAEYSQATTPVDENAVKPAAQPKKKPAKKPAAKPAGEGN